MVYISKMLPSGVAGSEVESKARRGRRKTALGRPGQCCRTSRGTGIRLRTVTDNKCPDVHSGVGDCCEVEDVSNER